MQSNYRHHHYLLSTANPAATKTVAAPTAVSQSSQSSTSSSASTSLSLSSSSLSPLVQASSSPNKLRQQFQPQPQTQHQQQQQHQQVRLASSPVSYMNGLPVAPTQHTANLCKSKASNSSANWQQQQQILSPYPSNCKHLASTQNTFDQLVGSQRHCNGNSRYFMDIQKEHPSSQPSSVVHRQPMQLRSTSRDYCNEGVPLDIPASQRSRQQQQQFTNNSGNNNVNNNNNSDTQAIILNKQQCEYLQHQHQQQQLHRQRQFSRHEDQVFDEREDELDERSDVDNKFKSSIQHKYCLQQDNYTSQIRNSQLQQRFQLQSKIQSGTNSTTSMSPQQQAQQQSKNNSQQQVSYQQHRDSASTSSSGGSGGANKLRPHSPTQSLSASPQSPASSSSLASASASLTANQQQSCKKSSAPLHVNFNRSNQVTGGDEDEGDSRKKKYLTAKYGQQQMNLIKKRLKIEMWLYEQLQDLAKGSKSEVSFLS